MTGELGDLRELLDWGVTQSPVCVSLLDLHLRHLRLNEAMCQMFGLEDETVALGRQIPDLTSGPSAESFVVTARQVIRTGKPARWEGPLRPPGQRTRQIWEATLSPVKNPAGQICGLLAIALNVTDQALTRQRLALVNEASTRIGTTLDITRTAEELAEVMVPQFADFVTVDLLESVLRGDEPAAGPLPGTAPLRRMAHVSVLPGVPEAVVRPGQVSAYAEASPPAISLRTGDSIYHDRTSFALPDWEGDDPQRAAHSDQFGFHAVMVVPIRARGATLGIAIFVRHQRPEPFVQDDLVLAQEVVARAAVCIDNARRYSREHATALTLQRSLLQHHQPELAAVEVASRYLPAESGVSVGGDWFDVIRLSGSRIGLVVGDVVGHGIHAAATMGRLRTAVRTLADIDLEPDELLTRLDDVVTSLSDEEGLVPEGAADLSATCLYAVYDPVTRRCALARAGHPLPLLVTPDGTASFLDIPAGPPLGLGGLPFEQAEVQLAEGSLLVLYTDGLVESRQRDIGTGLELMREVLAQENPAVKAVPATLDPQAREPKSLEALCERLVDAVLPDPAADDAALLIARTRAIPAGQIASWDLPPEAAIVAEARARAARQLESWGLDEITFVTELVVSELVTNAIRHAQSPIQLRLILDGGLFCEVSDGSSTAPHLRRADRYDEGGRGLLLVAQLTHSWGSRHTRTGKTIWAEQTLPLAGTSKN